MTAVRGGSHLERIGATWYYHRVVPSDARAEFGKRVVRVSLKTANRFEAERLEKSHDVEFETRLKKARQTGPGGFPRDPKIRIERMVDEVLVSHVQEGMDIDTALTFSEIAGPDRTAVVQEIDRLAGVYDQHKDNFRQLMTDLQDVILSTEDWDRLRPEIVQLVRNHMANRDTEFTVDWAYSKWQAAKERPEQTQTEARRYLDNFKHTTNVQTLSGVRRRHVTDWRDKLKKDGKLAPKSINQRLELVAAILRTGWRDAELPPADLNRINVPEPVTSNRTSWGREEILKALCVLEPHSWAAWMFVIALTTGTRIGEPTAAMKDWYDPNGFLHLPRQYTKTRSARVLPIIDLIRPAFAKYVETRPNGGYLFDDAPRPANPKLKIGHETSKWFGRFFDRHNIDRVFHELRHTWKEAARVSPIKKEMHDIISGHGATDVGDKYGGAKPSELSTANETICKGFLDPEMTTAIQRLLSQIP
jgi:hypothetical protein